MYSSFAPVSLQVGACTHRLRMIHVDVASSTSTWWGSTEHWVKLELWGHPLERCSACISKQCVESREARNTKLLTGGIVCTGRAGRVSPEQWPADVSQVTVTGTATASTDDRIVDFKDGDDPTIKAHWALLVAGSAG